MLIENKVQIKAIKTGRYMAGKADGTIMLSDGRFIVYIPEKDCVIDMTKIKELPKDILEVYRADKIELLLRPIELTNKALIFTGRTARLLENRETGDRIWLDDKHIKMFQGCSFHSADTEKQCKVAAFTKYGKLVGIVMPMNIKIEIQTNADRIRNMANKELAEFLCRVKADYQWTEQDFPSEDACGNWEEWLESEGEEGV